MKLRYKILSIIYLKIEVGKCLETLQTYFKIYFYGGGSWILNPFPSDINCIKDADPANDELIDLRTKNLLQLEFN
jgi:hypothetical protein